MKQTIINTFAAIGVITTFVLACSAALEESSISMKEGTYQMAVETRNVYVLNTDTGEMMMFDTNEYFSGAVGYSDGTWVDVVSNPVE
jgi:hypothetical protein